MAQFDQCNQVEGIKDYVRHAVAVRRLQPITDVVAVGSYAEVSHGTPRRAGRRSCRAHGNALYSFWRVERITKRHLGGCFEISKTTTFSGPSDNRVAQPKPSSKLMRIIKVQVAFMCLKNFN